MGRPKCTKEAVATAVKLKKSGASNKDIAAAIGIHEATFYRWINSPKTDNQRELCESLKKTEAEYKSVLVRIIMKSAQERDWKAAAWILERKYPKEFSLSPARFIDDAQDEKREPDPLTKALMELGGKL